MVKPLRLQCHGKHEISIGIAMGIVDEGRAAAYDLLEVRQESRIVV
jgi:hypothetical protein